MSGCKCQCGCGFSHVVLLLPLVSLRRHRVGHSGFLSDFSPIHVVFFPTSLIIIYIASTVDVTVRLW